MRSVEPWEGKNDDTQIPPRVRLRVFEMARGCCAKCSRRIGGRIVPCYDHIVAIANGGANSESNLQLLCTDCHREKTGSDVHTKSVIYNRKIKRLGLKKRKLIPGSKGSGFRKKMNGEVVRE